MSRVCTDQVHAIQLYRRVNKGTLYILQVRIHLLPTDKPNKYDSAVPSTSIDAHTVAALPYTNFNFFKTAHKEFQTQFLNNKLGKVCFICVRIWFKNDVKPVDPKHQQHLHTAFPVINIQHVVTCNCNTCRNCLTQNNNIPTSSKSNGFVYSQNTFSSTYIRFVVKKFNFIEDTGQSNSTLATCTRTAWDLRANY